MAQKSASITVQPHWTFLLLPILQLFGFVFFGKVQGLALYSFIPISLFASWRLFADGRPYSLNKLWWLFALLFLSLFPSCAFFRPERFPSAEDILQTNLAIMICLLLYEGLRLWASRNFVPHAEGSPPPVPGVLLRQYAHFAPPLVLTCGAAMIILFGFFPTFAPLDASSPRWLIVLTPFLRATMLWCCVAAIILYRQHRLGIPTLLLVLIPGVLFNFPYALSAPLCLTVFVAWLLASGQFINRRLHFFAWTMLAYFLIIDPACQSWRFRMTPNTEADWKSAWQEQLVNDKSWQSLNLSIHRYKQQEQVSGQQLIGAVLSFVPRSVWPTKPDGSELLLYKTEGAARRGGCTFLAEGYLNFGIWGSCVFSAALALLIAGYDGWYWRRRGYLRFTLPRLFYFAAFGMLYHFLIGDLQNAIFTLLIFAFGFTFWQSIFFWRIEGPKYQLGY